MSNEFRRRDAGQDGVKNSSILCTRCNDSRTIAESQECWACEGIGKYGDDVVCGSCDGNGTMTRQIECPDCPDNERVPENQP